MPKEHPFTDSCGEAREGKLGSSFFFFFPFFLKDNTHDIQRVQNNYIRLKRTFPVSKPRRGLGGM